MKRYPHTPEGLAQRMEALQALILEHYPDALHPIRLVLAVVATSCIRGNQFPTPVILVGPPSSGKTLVIEMLFPLDDADEAMTARMERCDDFTPASFITHVGEKSEKELKKIDLLSCLPYRTLLTAEMASQLRGKFDDLIPRFTKLTRILDGAGYVSRSGTQGRRGVNKAVVFQWIGGTTPISPVMVAAMGTLGARIVFYNMSRPPKTQDELEEYAMLHAHEHHTANDMCRRAVRNFVLHLFATHPLSETGGNVVIEVSRFDAKMFATWTRTVMALRAYIEPIAGVYDLEELSAAEIQESAERLLQLLRRIAVGSAIVHGRAAVGEYDLAQMAHVALSSGYPDRGQTLYALLRLGGEITVGQLCVAQYWNRVTAQKRLLLLVRCGLAQVIPERTSLTFTLAPAFVALKDAPLLPERGETTATRVRNSVIPLDDAESEESEES